MGTQSKAKSKTKRKDTKNTRTSASVCWFDIPADDPQRAKKFYSSLFGWKIEKFPGAEDYWHIDTGGPDVTPDGGMIVRKHPEHSITNYVAVSSVDKSAAKVEKLGGTICKPKTAVPQMGYFVICRDTEDNEFALWEPNDRAK
jgi:predicted enzyme related to lactoylglutathione lyase